MTDKIIRLNAFISLGDGLDGTAGGSAFNHDDVSTFKFQPNRDLFLFYYPIHRCLRALFFDNNNIYYNLCKPKTEQSILVT